MHYFSKGASSSPEKAQSQGKGGAGQTYRGRGGGIVVDRTTRVVRGCTIDVGLIRAWSQRFVFERSPVYLRADTLDLLPAQLPILSRSEMAADWVDLPLDARDAYKTYHVDPSADWVGVFNSDALLALEPPVRAKLLHLQWELGRGQIYPMSLYEELTEDDPAAALSEPYVFETNKGQAVSLQYEVWWALLPETRLRWLTWYVSRDAGVCRSSELSEEAWRAVELSCGPMPRLLAGTFCSRGGPNCFSTTLGAAIQDSNVGLSVAELWLHQEPFFRGLANLGFESCGPVTDFRDVRARSALVWCSAEGRAEHACFVPLTGWALNKDAQGWHAPRQLLPLRDVVQAWSDSSLEVLLDRT